MTQQGLCVGIASELPNGWGMSDVIMRQIGLDTIITACVRGTRGALQITIQPDQKGRIVAMNFETKTTAVQIVTIPHWTRLSSHRVANVLWKAELLTLREYTCWPQEPPPEVVVEKVPMTTEESRLKLIEIHNQTFNYKPDNPRYINPDR